VEKDFHPSVQGQGLRKGARDNKGVATSKIEGQILRCDKYFVVLYFSSEGPFSQDGSPYFIIIKSSQYWFSLRGFSRGIYPENMCA
jgi:hypothetical protein